MKKRLSIEKETAHKDASNSRLQRNRPGIEQGSWMNLKKDFRSGSEEAEPFEILVRGGRRGRAVHTWQIGHAVRYRMRCPLNAIKVSEAFQPTSSDYELYVKTAQEKAEVRK